MRAWYKPFHEPSHEQIADENTPEGYSKGLRRIDTHDLKQLRSFWYGEVKLLQNGEPLEVDLAVAREKLKRLSAELAVRGDNP